MITPFYMKVKEWTPQLEKITELFAKLQELDLEGVSPTLRIQADEDQHLRKDRSQEHPMSKTFLDTVPDRKGHFLRVPKINADAE
jgi:aspartyl/glutamyl-tRNA(Asn/Gln) amidotransferase C subunit